MITNHRKTTTPIVVVILVVVMLAGAVCAQAATAPVKEILSSHFGAKVNTTTGGNVCLLSETCRPGTPSPATEGFEYPAGVAGAPDGNIYVADASNQRVQELTATGEFVLMFGKEVNATSKGDVCLAGEKCQAGTEGTAAGRLQYPTSVTVDPVSGDVYVAGDDRIQKFTANGVFVLEIENTEHGGLNFEQGPGNLLAVGGQEDLLYVGERGRVEEFEPDGKWKGEISSTGTVRAVAVDDSCSQQKPALTESTTPTCKTFDPSFGDIYLPRNERVLQFTAAGVLLGEPIKSASHNAGRGIHIETITSDPTGRLAVEDQEAGGENEASKSFGVLYNPDTGQLITEFPLSDSDGGLGFNGSDELYVAGTTQHEIVAYTPEPVGELLVRAAVCVPGAERETDVTLDCSLNGEVDAWGVKETQVSFQWGRTQALGETTKPPSQIVNVKSSSGEEEPFVQVSAPIEGVRPNERLYERVLGEDRSVKSPEQLQSATESLTLAAVAPKLVGEPSASFVGSSSAVLSGELNPENTNTTYEFQYAPTSGACETLEACPTKAQTPTLESSTYGKIGATLEATGLQPATTYRYRLLAENEDKQQAPPGSEGTFTTGPAPVPLAATGPSSAVGATSATISGTVDPDGQPATYTFELGIYQGPSTQYGIVVSAAAGTTPSTQTLGLTGLQPGSTYAYRITISSGYGTQTGEAMLFTTTGLPAVLTLPSPLAQLAIPAIAFPAEAKTTKTTAPPKKPKKTAKKNKRKKTKKAKQTSHPHNTNKR